MVTKNINKLPKAQVEVQVTVPWADIAPKWDATLQKLSTEVELPGFRKGQAPLPMVEQNLGQKLPDEVFKLVMPQALIEALQGSDIVPIDYPQYQIISFTKGQGLQFKALITERPKVAVGSYKTIKALPPAVKQITEADVDKMVEDLFKRWKARQPATPPTTPPTPASTQPQTSTNGISGSMNFGSQPSTTPQLPQAPLNAQVSDTPDDNFARAVGAASLTDLKQKMRQDLENEAKYNNELDYEEAILQEVEKMTQVDIPEILVQDELNRMLVSLQRQVTNMGMLFDDYLRSQNKTLETLKADWRVQAERNVRMELGLSEIARQENVVITDGELQSEIDKIQDTRTKAQFQSQEPRMHLRHALRQTKTLDLLKTMVK